ncbi:MAG: alkaline phosphatase family protein [Polyangiales bacterium]
MSYRLLAGVFVCAAVGCGRSTGDEVKPAAPPSSARDAVGMRPGRVVVLGFDGVDPRWLADWAKQGKLPVIQRLMAGSPRAFHALTSTNPPQSPVAWTSFATGTLPGDHGIFDFIARAQNDAKTGLPVLLQVATTSFEVPADGPPVARNLRTGEPFWQVLGNQGVRVAALNVPYSFPPDPMRQGRMLSGLGVPDLRETNSTFTYVGTEVTDSDRLHPPGGGAMVKLTLAAGVGRFELEGPSLPGRAGTRMKLPVVLRAGTEPDTLSVTLARKTWQLPVHTWSDLIEVEFTQGSRRVSGTLRLMPLEIGARTRLFVSPISFHPREPYSALSYPRGFSAQLADELGHLYKTVGWDHDTSALNAEVIDEAAFLADMDAIERDRRAMLLGQLAHDDFDLLIWVSTAPDRAAHMFYRLQDRQHPRYDAALAKHYGDAIMHEYQRMDATVGAVLEQLQPGDTLLLLSDHGFHNYRRGLHVNQWLRARGLLTLKGAAVSADREFLVDVDWSKTKAYAVGTGQIYLNIQGREREGIVAPVEVPALTEQIKRELLALRDRERGDAVVVRNVYAASDVFRGKRSADAPDLQVGFAENYRTSWETILGGVPRELFADNDKKWSGDHAASDVAETPGFVLANRALDKTDPHIVDIAPTVHALFGKPIPEHYVGRPLFKAESR